MATIKAKGHEFNAFAAKDSFNRRALQFKNNIIGALGKIGLKEEDIEIPLEASAVKKANAGASWYMDGRHMYYSHNASKRFVDNLYVVSKVIELEVTALLDNRKTPEDFINEFSEDRDIEDKRKEARKVLGLSEDTLDMEIINEKYKSLAKECHPDMPNGDTGKFKSINRAHKILKRELE